MALAEGLDTLNILQECLSEFKISELSYQDACTAFDWLSSITPDKILLRYFHSIVDLLELYLKDKEWWSLNSPLYDWLALILEDWLDSLPKVSNAGPQVKSAQPQEDSQNFKTTFLPQQPDVEPQVRSAQPQEDSQNLKSHSKDLKYHSQLDISEEDFSVFLDYSQPVEVDIYRTWDLTEGRLLEFKPYCPTLKFIPTLDFLDDFGIKDTPNPIKNDQDIYDQEKFDHDLFQISNSFSFGGA